MYLIKTLASFFATAPDRQSSFDGLYKRLLLHSSILEGQQRGWLEPVKSS